MVAQYEDLEKLYTVAEVAHIASVTEWTVREWLKDPKHQLNGVKVGTQWRVPASNLIAYLEEKHG